MVSNSDLRLSSIYLIKSRSKVARDACLKKFSPIYSPECDYMLFSQVYLVVNTG